LRSDDPATAIEEGTIAGRIVGAVRSEMTD
jgi:hypothetical protein